MKRVNQYSNPGKDHKLYGSFMKFATVNKLAKVISLALVAIYLITVLFVPVFTIKTEYKSPDRSKVVYENSASMKLIELFNEREKFSGDGEKPFEDVEESVEYLRNKNFSDFERIANVDTAIEKIDENIDDIITAEVVDLMKNQPSSYLGLAFEADAVTGYTNDNPPLPHVEGDLVISYVMDKTEEQLGKFFNVFSEELEVRNTDGLREFLAESIDARKEIGDDEAYIGKLEELGDKYLVGSYTFNSKFAENVNELANVHRLIPDAALSKEDEAHFKAMMDAYNADTDALTASFMQSFVSDLYDDYRTIYFEYDSEAGKQIFKQNGMITYCILMAQIVLYFSLAVLAIIVVAIALTAIGFIKRNYKKIRAMSFIYIPIVLSQAIMVLAACGGNYADTVKSVLYGESIYASSSSCDIGSLFAIGIVLTILVFAVAIATHIIRIVYAGKFSKWLKTEGFATPAANVAAEAPVAEADVEEAPAEEAASEEAASDDETV